MIKLFAIIILSCFSLAGKAQPGAYAGAMKGLIKTVYTDSRTIPALSGWTFLQGSVLNPNEPEMITVDIFKKGTTYVVFFSVESDSVRQEFTIADVLEIKPVTKGWIIKTALCQLDNLDNPWVVAWAKITKTEYMKTLKKAWRFNPDKRQIEPISTKGIGCLNEGFDLTDLNISVLKLPLLQYFTSKRVLHQN